MVLNIDIWIKVFRITADDVFEKRYKKFKSL